MVGPAEDEAGYHRQHLFTSSVLGRWRDQRPGEPQRILELSRASDRASLVVPRRAGYVIDFIDEDRRHFEGAWNTIDDAAIRTLRSLDMHPEDPPSDADRRSIVDLVALHMVRGHGAQTYWEASRRRIIPERLAAVADGPAVREAAALAGEDPLAYAVSLTDGWEDQLRHGGRTFGEILLELLPSVASTLHSWDFTMVRSPDHDIIAPDVACVTVDDQAARVGVLGGVGLNDTSR